jgi:hypothetical protein
MQKYGRSRCVLLRLADLYISVTSIHVPNNKLTFLLIIEEKYCIISIFQDENYTGFVTIMDRIHTATHEHAKNRRSCCVLLRLVDLYINHPSIHIPKNIFTILFIIEEKRSIPYVGHHFTHFPKNNLFFINNKSGIL